jgi:N-acetylmuramoyl-L-alanine amidase/uncharacterized protein YjdB
MPMYVVHAADKLGESGWPDDMMTQQAAEISHLEAYSGSMFNTLSKMPAGEGGARPVAAAEPPPTPVPTPMPATNQPLTPTPVSLPAPEAVPVEEEPAYDEEDENIDGLEDSGSGSAGSSGSSELIKEIHPTGIIIAQEDDSVDIRVTAKKGANVVARINGDEIRLDEGSSGGSYSEFTGYYEVPDMEDFESGEYQYLGGLSVRASLNGKSQTFEGAFLSKSSNRVPVEVTAEQARTYPAGKNDNVPIPTLYPLPRGTIDYVVSDISEYTSSKGEHFKFVTLESGVRVETKDIDETSRGPSANNKISGIAVSAAPDSRYTYVTLKTEEKVAYSVAYSSTGLEIEFANTAKTPSDKKLSSNPLFTEASWTDDDTLNLEFKKTNGFMGYKAYYDANDNLVFRFKNPPKSIKGTKIALDPGHGGADRGGEGSDSRYPETVITHAMAGTVAEELESRGANVLVLDADGIEGPERAQLAEKWGADMLISLHCNTSSINPNASGTEAFYFYPFSYQLAAQSAGRVSKGYGVPNRGAKLSYYHVTLSPQMPSVLLETGFMTNEGDFNKLIKTSNHRKIADGVADSVEATIKAAYSGSASGGTESSGSTVSSGDDEYISYAGSNVEVDDIWFEENTVTVAVGETLRLNPIIDPEDAEDAELTWKSSSSSVVTVDSGGRIQGIRAGTATVSATASKNGGDKATVKVEVTGSGSASSASNSEISLKDAEYPYAEESYLTLYRNMPVKLAVLSFSGERVKNSEFEWKTSKSSVASVDQSGVANGRSKGTCTITAVAGDIEVEWEIEVSAETLEVKKITLEKNTYYVHEGGKQQLKWAVEPNAAKGLQVKWVSNKSGIATVDADGVVTGKKEGECTLIGTCGGVRVTVAVVVSEDAVGPDEIVLDTASLEMRVGDIEPLKAELSPDDITDSSVTWRSSNDNVATVDSSGNVKAVKAGTATITCTSPANGNATAACTITVY